jgi:hypothetical protein
MIPSNVFVTAGHCIDDILGEGFCDSGVIKQRSEQWLEFNVPHSEEDGTPRHPGDEDRYLINLDSAQCERAGGGADWAIFTVQKNSMSGRFPSHKQGTALKISEPKDLTTAKSLVLIIGYGSVPKNTEKHLSQQSAGGDAWLRKGDWPNNTWFKKDRMPHDVDTSNGVSGGPVKDVYRGVVIGVHGSQHIAMPVNNADFRKAIENAQNRNTP